MNYLLSAFVCQCVFEATKMAVSGSQRKPQWVGYLNEQVKLSLAPSGKKEHESEIQRKIKSTVSWEI